MQKSKNVLPSPPRCCPSRPCQLPHLQILCKAEILHLMDIFYDLFWPKYSHNFGLMLALPKYYPSNSFLAGQCSVKQKVQRRLFWGPGAVITQPSNTIQPFHNSWLPPLRLSHDRNHLVKLCATNFIISLDIISLIWFYMYSFIIISLIWFYIHS